MRAHIFAAAAALTLGAEVLAQNQPDEQGADGPISNPQRNPASAVRGIDRQRPDRPGRAGPPSSDRAGQAIDGSGNNQEVPEMGAAETLLARAMAPAYADGIAAPAGADRPAARAISNAVHAQDRSIPNRFGYSDFLWQWGQFLDHDIDLTDGAEPAEPDPLPVPAGDPHFDPAGTGTQVIAFSRSHYDHASGTTSDNPRQQINEITAWIDASNVYGSHDDRTAALRQLDGSGKLKTSPGDLLPFNADGLPNAGGSSEALFVAGDVRANEQVGLTVMHTLFMREHNRIAEQFAATNPQASGDEVFAAARRQVIALMQVITYRQFLPALLGPNALARYRGYDPSVDASIRNVFSTAAYRLGHTMLSPLLLRLDADGAESSFGHLSLADAFFRPDRLTREGGIEPILRGLASQVCQDVDVYVVDEVRNFLFGLPGSGGFDLPALNIQRGRDHGLGSYADARVAFGLPAVANLAQVTRNGRVARRLSNVYDDVGQVDIWTGGLAEDAVRGGLVGPLFRAILVEQFEALRDGDRFWYQRAFRGEQLRQLENTRLSDIIRRNTTIAQEIQDNVFLVE